MFRSLIRREGCSMGAGLGVGIAMAGFWVCGGNEKYVQAARLLDIETIEDRMRCPTAVSLDILCQLSQRHLDESLSSFELL
jgi:hypothetical protein